MMNTLHFLGNKTSENGERHPSQHPGVKVDVPKCVILFIQQSQTPKYYIYSNARSKKQQILTLKSLEPDKSLPLLLGNEKLDDLNSY